MQFLLNLAYQLISEMMSFLNFSPPDWFGDLVGGVVKYGIYANYFLPIGTFFKVALFCFTIHLLLMAASAVLQIT